jgi:hypothetical protein
MNIMTRKHTIMKKLLLVLTGSVLVAQLASAQAPSPPAPPPGVPAIVPAPFPPKPPPQKFDLNFPGGTPRALVAAIEKATGRPLNAIVGDEYDDVQFPPMKFANVTKSDLFDALSKASRTQVRVGNSIYNAYYGFESRGEGDGAVWYFICNRPPVPMDYCRFYQLADYLEDYKVEDITTAIETGWKLLGIKSPPQLKFHPETKLLIAVGPEDQLQTIDMVLQQLRKVPQGGGGGQTLPTSKPGGRPSKP